MATLFNGTITSGVTQYVSVPVVRGEIGLQIGWKDATSAAAITLELTDFPAAEAPHDSAGSAWMWKDSGLTIFGPTAAAAGSTLVHLTSVKTSRARLKIVPSANSDLEILDGM